MDIKLRSNDEIESGKKKRKNLWGFLVMLLILAGVTAGILLMYPQLWRVAFENAQSVTEYLDGYSGYFVTLGDEEYLLPNYGNVLSILNWLLLGGMFLTMAGAFVTALIKPLGMTEKGLFKAPLEIVAAIVIFTFGFMFMDGPYSWNVQLALATLTGELSWALSNEFYISPSQAGGILIALNALNFLFFYFVIYWAVTCMASVFTLGPVRYFKERTITGRFLRWCKRQFKSAYSLVDSIDFKDKSTRLLFKVVGINFFLLAVISSFWFYGIFGLLLYSIVLFFLLRKNYFKMQESYGVLLKATNELAEGNLDVEIKEDMGVFEPFRGEIGKIQAGFKKAVEEEVKSQSMKTELITNVSHDLKTPLTAIITYVDLLKKEDITEEERNSYIDILDQKSLRLKHLIEDLFEVSKANSRSMALNLVEVDVVNLMKQVHLELDSSIEASGIDFKWNLPEGKVLLLLDSEKTYRVFENLLINIIKYAMPGTRAYVDMEETGEEVRIYMKNVSAAEISLNGLELSERFVRGDASRNTEGSGLGLAIAKSFVELQNGSFDIEIEADLFKVILVWRKN